MFNLSDIIEFEFNENFDAEKVIKTSKFGHIPEKFPIGVRLRGLIHGEDIFFNYDGHYYSFRGDIHRDCYKIEINTSLEGYINGISEIIFSYISIIEQRFYQLNADYYTFKDIKDSIDGIKYINNELAQKISLKAAATEQALEKLQGISGNSINTDDMKDMIDYNYQDQNQ